MENTGKTEKADLRSNESKQQPSHEAKEKLQEEAHKSAARVDTQHTSVGRHHDRVLDEHPALANDLKTPCYKWQEKEQHPRAAVLLIHGFPEHGKLYDSLARKLASQGMVVYAPDMRGLGRSYSTGLATRLDYNHSSDGDLAVLAARIRKENLNLPLIVGGESMGGVFSIRLAAQHPELVDGIILSGAAIKNVHHYIGLVPQSIRNLINPQHKIDFSSQIKGYYTDNPKITQDLISDPLVREKFDVGELLQCKTVPNSTLSLVGRLRPELPVLLLQSVDDQQTDVPRSLDFYKHELHSKDFTVDLFPPRGHVLLETKRLEPDVVNDVQSWLKQRFVKTENQHQNLKH